MQEGRALVRFPAVRHVLVAAGIAVLIGSGSFVWLRHRMAQPATPAVLSFDADTAGQAEPWVMKTKEPAVAFARSILNDDDGWELEQASVSFSGKRRSAAEIRSHLEMAQPSAELLEVRYLGGDGESSAAANAVAKLLAAWLPASPIAAQATPVKVQLHRRDAVGDSPSEAELALKEQLSVVDQKLASLESTSNPSPQPADATEDDESQLRVQRGELTRAIAVEKRHESIERDLAAGASQAASPATPVPGSSGSTTVAVRKGSFVLVTLAKDAVQVRDSGPLLYAVPAGMLCGLVYLGGAMWRFRSTQSEAVPGLVAEETAESADTRDVPVSVASVGLGIEVTSQYAPPHETPMIGGLNNDPDAKGEAEFPRLMEMLMNGELSPDSDAAQPPDNPVEGKDFWVEEVKRVLAQASLGGEEDVLAARQAAVVNKPDYVGRNGSGIGQNDLRLKTSDRYAEVLESVRENIKRDPNIWMAHTEEARAALAARDFDKAAREMKFAIAVAPEELQARLGEIAAQMERGNMRGTPVSSSL